MPPNQISATLEKAQAANAPAAEDTAQAGGGEGSVENFAAEAEQMLERSMSVMWAAANLEVVMGSVSAVTSSTSTLIKQQ